MRTPLLQNRMLFGLAFAALVASVGTADAGHGRISGQANVRVWVEGGDVFDDYANVAVWLRPERDCYTTLFMVDTDGYVHVLYPSAPYHDTWLYGGRSYCYRASELGLDRLDGAGIAYVFAVGSPVPFDYSPYGAGVFVGGFGFRVYGDPFVACRDFYMTLLPVSCRWDFVGISYARFYVRHWARYPSYLCYGGPGVHVYVGDGCRACNDVYVSYRASCAQPWDAFRPVPRFKGVHAAGVAHTSRVERAPRASFKGRAEGRVAQPYAAKQVTKPSSREYVEARTVKRPETRSFATREQRAEKARVVSTSSARERARVDEAKVAAKSKAADHRVREERTVKRAESKSEARGTNAQATTREKGTKKKQAR